MNSNTIVNKRNKKLDVGGFFEEGVRGVKNNGLLLKFGGFSPFTYNRYTFFDVGGVHYLQQMYDIYRINDVGFIKEYRTNDVGKMTPTSKVLRMM